MRRLLVATLWLWSSAALAQQGGDDDKEPAPLAGKSGAPQAASPATSPAGAPAGTMDAGGAAAAKPATSGKPAAGASVTRAAPVGKEDAAARGELRGNLNLSANPEAEGHYKGVAPGAPALPPHPPRLPVKKGPQRMTWPGFQVKDGVPTVFLEVTAVPDYHVEEAAGAVTVTLKNTTVPLRNNRRPLDVTAFATAVQSVAVAPKGHDVVVTIKTKGGERPEHRERVEDAAGGFHLLVVELPK
jgi:hypothetical protein